MKIWFTSIKALLLFTIILGGIYPLAITALSSVLSPIKSHGSLLKHGQKVIGSEIIAQNFTGPQYFWPRPSNASYDPLSSSASQKSGTDAALKLSVQERMQNHPEIPQDLLWASASGLDPHIGLEAANYQKKRVMAQRGIPEKVMDEYIREATRDRFLGFMGQPRVNVLELNLLLDKK